MSSTTRDIDQLSERKELPEGWRWVKLGQVTRLINGKAYHASELLNKGTYPVLRVGNLFTSNHWYYSDLELEPDKYCDKGDLIFAWSASFGPFIWSGPKVIYHYHIWKVDCGQSLDAEYACHALVMITAKIKSESHGIAMLHMTKEGMEQFEIPLPPLPEQQRIAAILKEQMGAVEKARTAAQERLRAIKALPSAFLRQLFPDPGQPLPDGWRWAKLGGVCDFVGGSQPSKSHFKYEISSEYVRLVQIQDFRLSNVAVFIPKTMARRTFEVDDIMIGRYGPPVFQILRGLSGAYNVALMKAVPSVNLDKGYLFFLLQWPEIQYDVIAQSQRAAGQSGVQKEFLEKYEIPLPPLTEQQRIVILLEEQMAMVEKARIAAEAELKAINTLPAALLRRAFNGEL
ncbi:MAG: restriction endonuclease subunit S [Pelodictyon phaeoclathratiforme]